jgi:cytochrome oxidase Cu insertion factor (SCO1/SenC/PrrC family)
LLFPCWPAAARRRGGAKLEFQSTDLTGASFAKDFALTDHTGKPRTMADFKGKVVVMFFGYTQCPDVCPTTMAEMTEVLKQLGPQADQVQVLFVTVDPERDTQQLLAQYVPAFDKRFIGLYGTPEQTAAVAKEFKVMYNKVPARKAATRSTTPPPAMCSTRTASCACCCATARRRLSPCTTSNCCWADRMQQRFQPYTRLAAIVLLVIGCLIVLRPFLAAILFAAAITISSWPLYQRLLALKQRRTIAALVMSVGLTLLIIVPLALVTWNIADNASDSTTRSRPALAAARSIRRPG